MKHKPSYGAEFTAFPCKFLCVLWKLSAIVVKLTFCCCVREFSLHELQLDAFVGFLCAVITPIHDIFLWMVLEFLVQSSRYL